MPLPLITRLIADPCVPSMLPLKVVEPLAGSNVKTDGLPTALLITRPLVLPALSDSDAIV